MTLLLYGFAKRELRPLAAPRVSYSPEEYLHCILGRALPWSCAVPYPRSLLSPGESSSWGSLLQAHTPSFFLYVRIVMGPIKKKNKPSVFHFRLEEVVWQMESFLLKPSCHPQLLSTATLRFLTYSSQKRLGSRTDQE